MKKIDIVESMKIDFLMNISEVFQLKFSSKRVGGDRILGSSGE